MKIIPKGLFERFEGITEAGSFDILAEDGRPLFTLSCNNSGMLEVSTSMIVKQGDVMLDTSIIITPKDRNTIEIKRTKIG